MAILLGSTWDSILKFNTHPFLFASPFKIIIFSSIIPSCIPDQNTILSLSYFSIHLFLLKNNSTQNQSYLLQKITNYSYLQKWEWKVSWYSKTASLPKFCSAQQPCCLCHSFLPLPRHSLTPVRLRLIALPVAWVITSKGWPSSACRTFMFFLCGWTIDLANWALSELVFEGTWLWLPNHDYSWFGNPTQCCNW